MRRRYTSLFRGTTFQATPNEKSVVVMIVGKQFASLTRSNVLFIYRPYSLFGL